MSTYRIEFITPLFSRGAYENNPEVRPSSIRGQLHMWFRALGGNAADEKVIFGGVHGDATASRVVVRVSSLKGLTGSSSTLPHKNGAQASPKPAYQIGTGFDLHILSRLGGLEPRLQSALDRTLETWLLLGTLGLRGTRAAGSFCWQPTPAASKGRHQPPFDFTSYESRCSELTLGAPLRFALLAQVYPAAEQARRVVSDTLGGRDDRFGQNDLSRLNDPLGKIGGRGERKTSPLRFRIVGIGGAYRIAAVWDARTEVTKNRPSDLAGIIQLLQERKPALGEQLQASALAR